jgi:hypothetical protein
MGLDQYAYAREIIIEDDQDTPVNIEIAYWRKHNRLQGWMEDLFRSKFPDFEGDFNCEEVELTLEDLDKLESDIKQRALPETGGFFFGDDSYSYPEQDGMTDYDLQFIEKARQHIADGDKVIYSSWW